MSREIYEIAAPELGEVPDCDTDYVWGILPTFVFDGPRGIFTIMRWPFRKKHDYVCAECMTDFSIDPHVVGDRIVCKRCHDLLNPQCPYCTVNLLRKKVPTRRSSFKCKACGEQIIVEPNNWLYDSIYLDEHQAGYVGYVEQLDHWVFTEGSRKAYEQMREKLRKKFGGEPRIGDVIWGLMNQSVIAVNQHYDKQQEELRRTFDGRVPRELKLTAADKVELRDLRDLMKDFQAFERAMKAEAKSRKKRGKKSKAAR